MSEADTDRPVRYDHEEGAASARRRRALYVTFTSVVTLIVALALFEALVGSSVYGVDTGTTSASQAGTRLDVHYATVTRGELAVPLVVTIRRQGGFTEPVVLTLTADYFDVFSSHGPDPGPTSETATADDLILTFDPPPGDTLSVRWDLEAKAVGGFTTATGRIAVADDDQQPIVAVDIHTKVRP